MLVPRDREGEKIGMEFSRVRGNTGPGSKIFFSPLSGLGHAKQSLPVWVSVTRRKCEGRRNDACIL